MLRNFGFGLVGLFAFAIVVAIRRIYFHPFSKVPGPFLAKITGLYAAIHSWRGNMHLDIQKCHQKYGNLVRYAPDQILSLDPSDMQKIYGHGRPFRKAKGYATMIPIPDGWSTMTSMDKNLHQNLRRIFRSGVTSEALATYEPAILRNLDVYLAQLTKGSGTDGWSSTSDMRAWNLYLGFDTMADFGLGIKTNLLQSSDRDFVFPTMGIHEKKMGLWEQLPMLDNLGITNIVSRALLVFSPQAKRFNSWYQNFLAQSIKSNTTKSAGIFGPAIQSGLGLLEKPGHNRAQMIAEGSFSTFSAADAYSIMLCGFQHYLSRYPYVYDKLAAEMRCKFQPGQKIVWGKELESSLYLRAVIDEVMRLLPPACGVHWRECERPGVTVGQKDFAMPVEKDIGMSLFSLFRSPQVYRNPVLFWPERWIQGTLPEEEYHLAKTAFVPFSIGSRQCAGGHVAIMMASIAFAHLLVNYDFRLDPEKSRGNKQMWSNVTPNEPGAENDLSFESHYSIAGWESGPFIQFRKRT